MKKIWEKPNLVVLIRSRPEESVLTHCKVGGSGLEGGHTKVDGCHNGICDSNCDNPSATYTCIGGTCSGPEAS